jgi:tetratricopeptide (TPR) repeat protein
MRYAALLHERDPKDVDYMRWLAGSHYALGLLEARANRAAEARTHFETAARLQEELVVEDPDDKDYRFELANSLQNLGTASAQSGDWRSAEAHYARVLELRRLTDPESWPCHQARFLVGRALARQRRWTEAEAHLLAVHERYSSDPNATPKFYVPVALENGMLLAGYYLDRGEAAKAESILRNLPRETAPAPRDARPR